ncbi:MAG: beta-1,4-mannosyltransferase [Paraglaciecola sp.]|jgi:glycosyltransferase involved in cell wall biosynthesis
MKQSRIINIAAFPPTSGFNPYYDLFYGALSSFDFLKVESDNLTSDWLEKNKNNVDIIHFNWVISYYNSASFLICIKKAFLFLSLVNDAKKMGIKVVFTCHNLFPHESRSRIIDFLVRFGLMRLSDEVIVHSNAAKYKIAKYFLRFTNVNVVAHGNYVGAYDNNCSKSEARQKYSLNADNQVFLFFGSLQEYKGVLELIHAFKQVKSETARLILAGKASDPEFGKKISEIATIDDRILLINQYVPDQDIQYLFNASDMVVLPFRKILTSGSLLLAYSFGKPVLIPHSQALDLYCDETVTSFIEGELVTTLEKKLVNIKNNELPSKEFVLNWVDRFSWPSLLNSLALKLRVMFE